MSRPATTQQESGGCSLMLVVGAILALLAMLGQCGKDDVGSQAFSDKPTWGEDGQTSSDPPKIAEASIALAKLHAERAVGALGEEGASVYSENCRAALQKSFSIDNYDRCYAFDLLAGRLRRESVGTGYFSDFSSSSIDRAWERAFAGQDADALSERKKLIAAAVVDMDVAPEAPPTMALQGSETSDGSGSADEVDADSGETDQLQDDDPLAVEEMSG